MTAVRAAWTRLSTWMADYERPVGPPMLGVIPSTLAADRAVVEAYVMTEPAGDVAAAVERLKEVLAIARRSRGAVSKSVYVQADADLALLAQATATERVRAVTKLLALHEECDDDVPCSILSDLRALLAPPAPAP